MTATREDRQQDRQQAWIILSELFLDTDVAALQDHLIAQLRALPFGPQELENILRDEVYLVCIGNLRQVAGIWQGFEPQGLITAIERQRAKSAALPRLGQWWRARGLARNLPEWAVIRRVLEVR